MNQQTTKPRIQIIDALRGFSLAGIVLVHMVENYVGGPTTEAFNEATHTGALDYVVEGFNQIVLRGKFFALFSFLFGLSFFLFRWTAGMPKARSMSGGFCGGSCCSWVLV